jgi:hypothetical protein
MTQPTVLMPSEQYVDLLERRSGMPIFLAVVHDGLFTS